MYDTLTHTYTHSLTLFLHFSSNKDRLTSSVSVVDLVISLTPYPMREREATRSIVTFSSMTKLKHCSVSYPKLGALISKFFSSSCKVQCDCMHMYRMAGNFREVLIFVIFVVDLAVMKITTHHYTNLTFVCDVRPSVRAGGHGKPFDPS